MVARSRRFAARGRARLIYVSLWLAFLLLVRREYVRELTAGVATAATLVAAYGLGERLFPIGPGIVAAFAFAGAFSTAESATAQYQYKVTLCHETGSNHNPGVTISVSADAVAAHLRHGDSSGACN